jgi:hypothetical protein
MIFEKVHLPFRIRIRINNLKLPGTDPDPAKTFGSLRIRIRIHNTAGFTTDLLQWPGPRLNTGTDNGTYSTEEKTTNILYSCSTGERKNTYRTGNSYRYVLQQTGPRLNSGVPLCCECPRA